MRETKPVLLSWSSGKDSSWTLHRLQADPDYEVVGLMTTFNKAADRVAMHAVRRQLAIAQAAALELPLWQVDLPWPCSNVDYEAIMKDVTIKAEDRGITHIAFGDLYLEDIRSYREKQLAASDLRPIFPLWQPDGGTRVLARQMIAAGLKATVTCVDPKQLSPDFLGRRFDAEFLSDLPDTIDPCGENGEFHTFCSDGPSFLRPVPFQLGECIERDGFCFQDLLIADET
ncbi:MAG: ATP-binding protein [Planctomycetota bacterium]